MSGKRDAAGDAVVFESEFVTGLKKIFEEMIVFNKTLGLTIQTLEPEQVVGRIVMRHALIGHFAHNRVVRVRPIPSSQSKPNQRSRSSARSMDGAGA